MTFTTGQPEKATTIRPYPLGRLVAATALLILILSAATSAMLLVSYDDTLRQEKTNLRNLALAFAAQTSSVTHAVENVMVQAERGYAAQGAGPGVASALASFLANSMARDYLLGIYLYDNEGRLVASGRPAPTSIQ
jgi:hypothetical protein